MAWIAGGALAAAAGVDVHSAPAVNYTVADDVLVDRNTAAATQGLNAAPHGEAHEHAVATAPHGEAHALRRHRDVGGPRRHRNVRGMNVVAAAATAHDVTSELMPPTPPIRRCRSRRRSDRRRRAQAPPPPLDVVADARAL